MAPRGANCQRSSADISHIFVNQLYGILSMRSVHRRAHVVPYLQTENVGENVTSPLCFDTVCVGQLAGVRPWALKTALRGGNIVASDPPLGILGMNSKLLGSLFPALGRSRPLPYTRRPLVTCHLNTSALDRCCLSVHWHPRHHHP